MNDKIYKNWIVSSNRLKKAWPFQNNDREKVQSKWVFYSLILVVAAFIFSGVTNAAEPLAFGVSLNPRLQSRLDTFIAEKYKALPPDISIARADLNGDEINELIVRTACGSQTPALCDFIVLADTDSKLTELGVIKAFSMNIADTAHNGIRNIIAFSNVTNQFKGAVYIWDSLASRYTIER